MVFRQFFAGYNGNFSDSGVWLSRPGVDVLGTVNGADFLLKSDLKNDQIVLSGTVFVPADGSTVTVYYPVGFQKYPYILHKPYINAGQVEHPYNLNLTANDQMINGQLVGYDLAYNIQVFQDHMVFFSFHDTVAHATYVDFMVFYRSLGT